MSTNHVQAGNAMDWTNGTGAAVVSGQTLAVNDMVCVASGDIADGDQGVLFTEEVFELPKEAPLVISQGEIVYFDTTAKVVNKTDTNVRAGKCFKDAASADTTVYVKLGA